MHERALVSEVAMAVTTAAAGAPVGRVTLSVGPDTNAAVVEETWRTTTAGTPLGDATLACVVHPHGLQCLDCGVEFEGGKLSRCPACGGNGLVVTPAPEVALQSWAGEVTV